MSEANRQRKTGAAASPGSAAGDNVAAWLPPCRLQRRSIISADRCRPRWTFDQFGWGTLIPQCRERANDLSIAKNNVAGTAAEIGPRFRRAVKSPNFVIGH